MDVCCAARAGQACALFNWFANEEDGGDTKKSGDNDNESGTTFMCPVCRLKGLKLPTKRVAKRPRPEGASGVRWCTASYTCTGVLSQPALSEIRTVPQYCLGRLKSLFAPRETFHVTAVVVDKLVFPQHSRTRLC